MASSTNTKTLSLCFLFSLILFFVHGHARDMKEEKEVQTEKKESKAYITQYGDHGHGSSSSRDMKGDGSSSNSKPYITNYGDKSSSTSKEEDSSYTSSYKAAYNPHKDVHAHASQNEDSNPNYLIGYIHSKKNQREMGKPYVSAYGEHGSSSTSKEDDSSYTSSYKAANNPHKDVHVHASQNEDSNANYLIGYIHSKKNQREMGKPYVSAYGEHGSSSTSKEDDSSYTSSYKAAYNPHKDVHVHASQNEDSNPNYLIGYIHSKKNQREMGKPYVSAYGEHGSSSTSKEDDSSYTSSYKAAYNPHKDVHVHASQNEDSNPNYLIGYIHSKKNQREIGKPYVSAYGEHGSSSTSKEDDSSYTSSYKAANNPHKDVHVHASQNEDSNPNYLIGYIHSKKNQREMGKPYVSAYGEHGSSSTSKEDDSSYTSSYKAAYNPHKDVHVHASQNEDSNPNYLIGYIHSKKNQREMGKPYVSAYGEHGSSSTSKEDDSSYTSSYKAAYNPHKDVHVHASQNEDSNPNYLIGYIHSKKNQREMGKPYVSAYGEHGSSSTSKEDDSSYTSSYKAAYNPHKDVHAHASQNEDSNPNYLIGYIHSKKNQREMGKPYVSAYGEHGSSSTSKEDDSSYTSPYKAAYNPHKDVHVHASQNEDSNPNYLIGYIHSKKNQREMGKPYVSAYGEHGSSSTSKEDDSSYTSSYKAAYNPHKDVHVHASQNEDSNPNYLIGYIHSKKNQREIGKPYVSAYGEHGSSSTSKEDDSSYTSSYKAANNPHKDVHVHASQNEDSNPNYHIGYIHSKKNQREIGKPYVSAYGEHGSSSTSKEDDSSYKSSYKAAYNPHKDVHVHASQNEDSNPNYLIGYIHSKKNQREMGKPYAGTYRKETRDTYASTYKVDHTEAFKTGFFSLDDLYIGNRMTLQFPIQDFPHFLPKKEANSIPFSMAQLPSLFQLFSVSKDSPQGEAMRDTLELCELEPLTGETKTCVSSLESMIDFVHTIIGSESQLDILTTTLPTTSSVPLQNFTVLEISQDIYAPEWVACHPLPYPYAVFYCHFINTGSKIFKVQLSSDNGERIEAQGICHLDTSEWSPGHILFKQLGFKPGEAPVCHFFPVKHLMWVPQPLKAAM